MASKSVQATAPPAMPLIATVDPVTGGITITHGTIGADGVPVYTTNPGHVEDGPFDGEIFGVSKKLLLASVAVWLLLKKR